MAAPTPEEPLKKDPREELPESVQEEFDNVSEPQENIEVVVISDMNLDGLFEENWLLATDRRILVFSGNHDKRPEIIHDIPMSDIDEVNLKNYVGNGFLEVKTADKSLEILRFSKTAFHKNDIAGVPRAIDRLREKNGAEVNKKKGHDSEHGHEGKRSHRCEKCGRIISHWAGGTCSNCLEKRTLIARLFSYLIPYWHVAAIAFVLLILGTGLSLVPTYITKYLTDIVFAPVEEKLVFDTDLGYQADLANGSIPAQLRQEFQNKEISLSQNIAITVVTEDGLDGMVSNAWLITDSDTNKRYIVRTESDELSIYEKFPRRTKASRLRWLNVLVLAIIGLHVLSTCMGTARTYMMRWLGNKIIYDLRTSAYDHLQRLSLSFYNKKETGRLMSRISYDTERLQDFIVRGLQDFIRDILMMVGMCVILFVINWRLAALTLLPIPILTFGSYIFGKKMHMVYHKVYRRMAGLSAILADTIPGVRVVKAFAAEDREVGRFNDKSDEYFSISMRAAKLSTIYYPIMGFAMFAGGVIVRWFGGRNIVSGDMTLGDMMLFMGYMFQFYGPIQGLTRLNHMLQRSASAAERVFEIMDAKPEVADKKDAIELPTIQGNIKFDNVVFSYDDEKNALDGVSFEIKAGEMIGLSGPSGAGKTTLINLLGRFYDVTEGSITVDGHDVRDVTMKSLRNQIGVVLQDPFLFHGSVAENIAYSNPRVSRADIVAAAKAANAHDFIVNFPDGYDTMVGERGTGLSGGEKQRISIARAVLKDPRILILDEATSSVDTETESLIQAALERLVEGRTTFAIAHRLSTLRKADKLIILDKGELTEMGTHNELMNNNGLYKRLVDLQSELSSIKAV